MKLINQDCKKQKKNISHLFKNMMIAIMNYIFCCINVLIICYSHNTQYTIRKSGNFTPSLLELTEYTIMKLFKSTFFFAWQYFIYIMATSFSDGRSRSTRREPPTMYKQLVNLITCGCESSAPFLQFTKPDANPCRIGDRLIWVAR